MGVFKHPKKWFRKTKLGEVKPIKKTSVQPPLREFVYLDEVSLQSLLSSQKGEVTENVSSESSETQGSEISSSMSTNVPAVVNAELNSSLQSESAKSTQISRKATVQSWFGELHAITSLRKISYISKHEAFRPLSKIEDIGNVETHSSALRSDKLIRGSLVEMRVVLRADPVFKVKTLIAEFSDMIGKAPEVFEDADGLEVFDQIGPIHTILQKLLAGLIPLRCEVLDYVAITFGGDDYIVEKRIVEKLDIETRPIQVVGVTELTSYWKDIRRVLFSDAAFTVLARVGVDGLQREYNPVKLVQIFQEFAPTLVDDISNASSIAVQNNSPQEKSLKKSEVALQAALSIYGHALLEATDTVLTDGLESIIERNSYGLKDRWKTVSDQRSAFKVMHDELVDRIAGTISSSDDLKIRESSRSTAGLSLFPNDDDVEEANSNVSAKSTLEDTVCVDLIDVEFVAIYW